jgi:hypothetical protein
MSLPVYLSSAGFDWEVVVNVKGFLQGSINSIVLDPVEVVAAMYVLVGQFASVAVTA